MNLDAISRAANENTDPDPSDRDFAELMANALRVCLDDLLANRGPGYGDPALPSRLGRPVVPGTDQPPKPVKPAPKPPTRPVVPGQDQPPKESDPAPKMPQITPAMLERLRKRIAGE